MNAPFPPGYKASSQGMQLERLCKDMIPDILDNLNKITDCLNKVIDGHPDQFVNKLRADDDPIYELPE